MLRLFVPDIDCLKGLAWIGKVFSGLGLASLHPRKDDLGIVFRIIWMFLLDCREVQSQQDIPVLVALLPGILG